MYNEWLDNGDSLLPIPWTFQMSEINSMGLVDNPFSTVEVNPIGQTRSCSGLTWNEATGGHGPQSPDSTAVSNPKNSREINSLGSVPSMPNYL